MWNLVLNYIVSAAISYLLTPRPKVENAVAATQAEVPVAKEGGNIGVIFGTVWIKDPTVVDYDELVAEPIRKSQPKK